MDFEAVISTVVNWATTTGVKIIVALLILFVSFKIINGLTKRLDKVLSNKKRPLDKTLRTTFIYLIKLVGKCLVAVALIGYLGIDTSGITALIASLGVCVGLAVNGALSNLAGGVMLLVTRPFKVDDFIEAQGYSGTVEDIHIVSTRIRTADNKVVYIPNGSLSSGTIVNYSEKGTRRLELTFSIAYENDFERAKEIVLELAASHELVMKDPAPFVRLSSHAQSSLDIVCRVWTQTADYWTVNFDLLESVKLAFDKAGISIPYNQLDVHVKND